MAAKPKRTPVRTPTTKRSVAGKGHPKGTEVPVWDALGPSITARITRLRKILGDPFHEDRRLAYYADTLDQMDAMRADRKRLAPKADFLARVEAFLAAHEIARRVLAPHAKKDRWGDVTDRASSLEEVEMIARGHVRTLSQLKDMETVFFTRWNEGPARETNPFWREIERAKLPFVRRDLLAEIFARGRITSREHYEWAIDMLGVGEEEGLFDAKQAERLSRMVGDYEKARSRR